MIFSRIQGVAVSRAPVFCIAALITALLAQVAAGQVPRPLQRSAGPQPRAERIDPRALSYPALGQSTAPVMIVEFSEFGCPYCKRHAGTVLPQVLKKYVDAGSVRYLFVQTPPEGEQASESGARALICAAHLDALWPMYQQLYRAAPLDASAIQSAAAQAGVDGEKLDACMQGARVRDELQEHIEFARRNSVIGTPTFLIGRAQNDRLVDVKTTFGIQDVAFFETSVERLLKRREN
jgi:protein-disulfide isomerase